jgi:hypothetical protein
MLTKTFCHIASSFISVRTCGSNFLLKGYFQAKPSLIWITQTFSKFSQYLHICLWRWNRQSVPKRRHIKFRSRGITQKKTNNTQHMAKVWNQEYCLCFLGFSNFKYSNYFQQVQRHTRLHQSVLNVFCPPDKNKYKNFVQIFHDNFTHFEYVCE